MGWIQFSVYLFPSLIAFRFVYFMKYPLTFLAGKIFIFVWLNLLLLPMTNHYLQKSRFPSFEKKLNFTRNNLSFWHDKKGSVWAPEMELFDGGIRLAMMNLLSANIFSMKWLLLTGVSNLYKIIRVSYM